MKAKTPSRKAVRALILGLQEAAEALKEVRFPHMKRGHPQGKLHSRASKKFAIPKRKPGWPRDVRRVSKKTKTLTKKGLYLLGYCRP